MIGRWYIGPHPVHRYAERILGWHGRGRLPEWLYRQCRAEIAIESRRAAKMTVQLWGSEVWQGERARYVVCPPAGDGLLPALLTVLGKRDRWG